MSLEPLPSQNASDSSSLPLYMEMLRFAAVPQGTHFVPLTWRADAYTMVAGKYAESSGSEPPTVSAPSNGTLPPIPQVATALY